MQIEIFLNRISGPDIGVYCLDLFAMNLYEFYQFIAICIANYFIITKLLSNNYFQWV